MSTRQVDNRVFGPLLRKYRTRTGASLARFGKQIGVDHSYITRVELSQREPPRLPIVQCIASELKLSSVELDNFMLAASYAPPSLIELGGWDDVLTDVVGILNDKTLADEDKKEFRLAVHRMAKLWQLGLQ